MNRSRAIALVFALMPFMTAACATPGLPTGALPGPAGSPGACEAPDPPAAPTAPVPVDLTAETPQLDRDRAVRLEAFSADGALALLRVDDSARGLAYLVVRLDGTKPPRELSADGGQERDARQRGLRALGPEPVTRWSPRHPLTGLEASLTELDAAFAIVTEVAGAPVRPPLALLPRHATERWAGATRPASTTGHLVAWSPDGAHLVVIYGQLTQETPPIRADRWFIVRAATGTPGDEPTPP